jgi:hypothetical protein
MILIKLASGSLTDTRGRHIVGIFVFEIARRVGRNAERMKCTAEENLAGVDVTGDGDDGCG